MAEYKKGANTRLSDDFVQNEFDCKGKTCCRTTVVDGRFIEKLQGFRDYLNVRFGAPVSINVNSGYRCERHNSDIGASKTSKHCLGRAADVNVRRAGTSVSAKKLCCCAQDYGFEGIGYINLAYVHLDNRNGKWYADETKGNRVVTDFYRYFGLERTDKNPYPKPDGSVKSGVSGDGVRWAQWYLYCLRHYPEPPDGRCGPKTVAAIRAFQKKHGLAVDGSCGPKTRATLQTVWSNN